MNGASPETAKLYDPQTLFEKLFESSPDAILVSDPDGRITEANAQVEELFGYSRAELLGQRVEVLIPERFRHAHLGHRKDYGAQPRMRPMGAGLELFGRRKDGSEFPVDIMLSPVEMPGGRVVLSVIRDISEKKRAEEALRQSEQQLRLLVESVKDYAVFLLDPEGRILTWSPGEDRTLPPLSRSETVAQMRAARSLTRPTAASVSTQPGETWATRTSFGLPLRR